MNFTTTYEKITESKIFKNFIAENPKAELVAGFFILDFLSNDSKKALDYKIGNKIITFSLNLQDEIILTEDKLIEQPGIPELTKISPSMRVDLDEIPSLAEKQAEENNIKAKFQKIIAVLQIYKHEDKDMQIWNLTCMLDGLIILNILIDSDTGQIIKFERKSLTDFVKKR